MFKKILVPVDGSISANKALDVACEIAKKFHSEIHIICVFYHHSFIEGALFMDTTIPLDDPVLTEALSDYSKDVIEKSEKRVIQNGIDISKVKGFVKEGHCANQIVELSETNSIDLIVIAQKKEKTILEYLFGGTSLEVAKLAKCGTLII